VLDIGGQDTKGIQVDADGIVENFQMNDRCAAGCGRYLGYIADEMKMGLHELGPMAMKATRSVRINSTCTVFAGAELRDRLALGEKREDILAGLHRAIVLRAMSIISRSGGIRDQFTFTGGVAKNEAAVRELKKLVQENYGDVTININPESIYTGALGAATGAKLAGLGFPVLGWSRLLKALDGITCLVGEEGLVRLLEKSRILILILPSTNATREIMNAERLALLPRGACLINAGRGSLIDDTALLDALATGHLHHATLDVFREEPLPGSHPFWRHPGITVTPHVAAATRMETAADAILAQIGRDMDGFALQHVVEPKRGY